MDSPGPRQPPIRRLIVLGDHIQTLGIVRMAAEVGVETIVFNGYAASVARFSRFCNGFEVFNDRQDLLSRLVDKADSTPTVLMPTNDDMVAFLAENHDLLSSHYILSIADPEVVSICVNKRKTYRAASEMGIPIPRTYFPDSDEDLRQLSTKIQFPVILKPAIMHKYFEATGRKAVLCNGPSELVEAYTEFRDVMKPEEVIVQQFLSGGAASLFSFGSFFAEGQAFGGFVANRVRQKPMDFGISTTFARTVVVPQIVSQAEEFLRGIGYTGISEVEFMYDESTDRYLLLEINARTWKWHSISNKVGMNLISMLFDHLQGHRPARQINEIADIGWVERLTDTWVAVGEILKGRLTFSEYVRSLRIDKESAAWTWSDPLPAIMYLVMTPYLLYKRN